MGDRRDTALLVVIVAAVLALAYAAAPDPETDPTDPRASSFRAAEPGTLALFLTLRELGLPVERRVRSWVDGEPLEGSLVLLAPSQPLTPDEVTALTGWVEEGGVLIYAARPGDPLLAALGLGVARARDGVGVPAGELSGALRWVRGVERVDGFRYAFADTTAAFEAGRVEPVLATAARDPLVVLVESGRGWVLAWSDVQPLSNGALRESGAALLLARAAAAFPAAAERLEFDEFHHGYREGAGVVVATLRAVRDTGPGRMAGQVALAGLGLLWLLGQRFGAPHPPPPARRRSPLEHVEALGGALHRGGARRTARSLLVTGAARRMGRPAPRPGEESAWLADLAVRRPAARPAVDALLREWARGDEADLPTLARLTDALVPVHSRRTARSR